MRGVEYITGVAIMVDGVLYQLPKPKRHTHCTQLAFDTLGKIVKPQSEGFVTNTGRYVLKKEALKIAKESGQLLDRYDHSTELRSELIW